MSLNFPAGVEGDIFRASNDTRYVYEGGAWRVIDGAFTHNPGPTEPLISENGDLWVDTSECPPVLMIYVDETTCPGEGGWQEISGGSPDLGISRPTLTGLLTEGEVLTCSPGVPYGGNPPYDLIYTFYHTTTRSVIQTGTENTYTTVDTDIDKSIYATVTVTDTKNVVVVSEPSNTLGPIVVGAEIVRPTVLHPNADDNFSGGTEEVFFNSDTITKVEGAGENVYTTDTIASVDAGPNSLIPTNYSSQIEVPGGFNGSEGSAFDGSDLTEARCNGCNNAWYTWNIPAPHYAIPDGGVLTVHAFNPNTDSASASFYYLKPDGSQGTDKITVEGSDNGETGSSSSFSTQPGELDGKIIFKPYDVIQNSLFTSPSSIICITIIPTDIVM